MAKRKSKRGPLDYGKSPWLIGFGLVTFIVLYAPIAQLIAFSFNDSKRNIVWRGFTTKYYAKAWNDASLVEAFVNSITIAVMCTVIATIIGTATALWLWRFRFPAKSAVEGVMVLPIVIPEICMGVAVLVLYSRVGNWMRGFEVRPDPLVERAVFGLAAESRGHNRCPHSLQFPVCCGCGAVPPGRVQSRV